MADSQTTLTFAPGEVVIVLRRGKPGYKAVVGTVLSANFSRITVRPLPGHGETDRARSVWRRAVFKTDQTTYSVVEEVPGYDPNAPRTLTYNRTTAETNAVPAVCRECGMLLLDQAELHPWEACQMFLRTHDGDAVRAAFPGSVKDGSTEAHIMEKGVTYSP